MAEIDHPRVLSAVIANPTPTDGCSEGEEIQ